VADDLEHGSDDGLALLWPSHSNGLAALREVLVMMLWLALLVVAIGLFYIGESLGWKSGKTLSFYIAKLGRDFPLAIWICGVFAGALAVHFFWHYCPFGGSVG
jgi:hypothetical protein